MTKRKKEEKIEDRFAIARKKRKEAHEAKEAKEAKQDEREEFRKFFVKIKGKLGLGQDMEGVIWKHFKSSGFAKKDKFKEGIKHFGYKL